MAQAIREVMIKDLVVLPADASLEEASRQMRDREIGDVIVVEGQDMAGILTDRDIVIRAIAEGRSAADTTIGEIASRAVATVSPDTPVETVIDMMRAQAIRRIPVVDAGKPVGIVSLGDLAIERDGDSALADISAAEPSA
jgi:CBS domain-containing protein